MEKNSLKKMKLVVMFLALLGVSGCSSKNCHGNEVDGLCEGGPKTSVSSNENYAEGNGIIGGRAVNENGKAAKSTVAIFDKSSQSLCTGTLIDSNIVLTAAHCVGVDVQQMVIIFNNDLDCEPGTELEVRAVQNGVRHPSWDKMQGGDRNTGDVALLKFNGSIPVGNEVVEIIKNIKALQNNSDVILAGYGVNDGVGNSGSGKLRQVHAHIGNVHFSDSEIQIDQKDGVGACHGDSGGPAFMVSSGKYYVWGITSRGEEGCRFSSVYTRVDSYLPWIRATINSFK
jgi:V8-like Glu-specific endopeptidase